jgi:hypothetical protein
MATDEQGVPFEAGANKATKDSNLPFAASKQQKSSASRRCFLQ